MSQERRNYYRILHVQPEAPVEIITASYRSMMTKLRHHPDLGGDHDTAAIINKAYSTLIDPEKRKAYDQKLQSRAQQRRRVVEATASSTGRAHAPEPCAEPVSRAGCGFCGEPLPRVIVLETRCGCCASPLAPVVGRNEGKVDPLGSRRGSRTAKNEFATVHIAWGRPTATARLRDLSASGLSFYTAAKVEKKSVVRIVTPDMDVLAKVVNVRRAGREGILVVHARMLTAYYASRSGVFVAMRV